MDVTSIFSDTLFEGKTVFITGGGSGINLEIAHTFAALGANIGICGRTQDKLDSAAEGLLKKGASVFAKAADVRDFDALQHVISEAGSVIGPIDVMVCAAAGNFICPAEKMSANAFKTVIDIDLLGSFNSAKAALAQLKKTRGSLIFISAGMSEIPYAAQAHVGAAKSGIDNLMRNLALEWGPYGIRSNSIIPGPIAHTEGMRRLAPGELGDELKKQIPLGRFGRAEEIGQAAAFLASPLASYITGTALRVDGGQNLPGSGFFSALISRKLAEKQVQPVTKS